MYHYQTFCCIVLHCVITALMGCVISLWVAPVIATSVLVGVTNVFHIWQLLIY